MYTCIDVRTYICILYTRIYVNMFMRMYIYIYTYICVCVYIYICGCINLAAHMKLHMTHTLKGLTSWPP